MSKKRLSLSDCRSREDVRMLPRDNYGIGEYWMCCDGREVTVVQQKRGENPKAMVSIPMREFNHLVRQYQRRQRIVRGKEVA